MELYVVKYATHPVPAQASLGRDAFIILCVNALEVPLDADRIVSVRSVNSNGRSYVFHGTCADPRELCLTVSFTSHTLSNEISPREQRDLEMFESILSQYADFRGAADDADVSPSSSQPPGKIMFDRDEPNDSRLRGQLVLVNEDTGEIIGEVEKRLNVKEDPGLAEKGHEKDPIVIEIPEGVKPTEGAVEVFARTVSPDEQNWMMTGAVFVSQGISDGTDLLVNFMTRASNHFIAHSEPSTSKNVSALLTSKPVLKKFMLSVLRQLK
ncbi:hypothetical protein K435DRAFT_963634 [Dendrothele bispora CBS 962.96]|uniref:Uncharacterized protein n=1 Tax=Dendrothele bispora (strain CBS 962.96) TaxID=1314807 RepID=A0A4S8MFU3_DENBC|nr:hypothetical protein K435DRAFT_963634 [Dendrothele bispora CBS 962.96]